MPKTVKVLVGCPDRASGCRERHYKEVLEAEHMIEMASYNSSSQYYGEFANGAMLAILNRVQELEEEVRKLKEEINNANV